MHRANARSDAVDLKLMFVTQFYTFERHTAKLFALLGCWEAFPYGLDISHGQPQLVLVNMSKIKVDLQSKILDISFERSEGRRGG